MSEKPIDSKTLFARAAELERSLEAARTAIAAAESDLADAFGAGVSPKTAQDHLAAARQNLADRITALGRLEAKAHASAVVEYNEARVVVETKFRELYQKAAGAVLEAVEGLVPVFGELGLGREPLDQLSEGAQNALWEALLERQGVEVRALGPAPKAPLPRDEDGRQIAPSDLARGALGIPLTPREIAHRDAMARFNAPGSALLDAARG